MATIEYLTKFTKSFLNQDLTSNIGKLWSLFSIQLDEIETQITLLKNILSITDNSGLNLDHLGNLVNQVRIPGESDALYKFDLFVAILSKIAGGTIPELVSIGKIIAGNDENAYFRPFEMWQLEGTAYLDASDLMNGYGFFSPDTKLPATVLSTIEGDIDSIEIPLEVGSVIDDVRGAGITAQFNIVFKINMSKMTLYSGNADQPHEIALGDGATRDPLPGDTGLENEVYRNTISLSESNGYSQYSLFLLENDLNTYTMNEIALFDNVDVMIVKYTFDGKAKNVNMVYEYQLIDDL